MATYVAIYRTTLVPPGYRFEVGGVGVESFVGPRAFLTMMRTARVVPIEEIDSTLISQVGVELAAGETFLALSLKPPPNVLEERPTVVGRRCEDLVDRTIACLALILTPHMFCDLIFKDWVIEGDEIMYDGSVIPADRITTSPVDLPTLASHAIETQAIAEAPSAAPLAAVELMCRFYAKALTLDPTEERFLLLWTVLEIFPMRATSDIRPLVGYLADLTGREPALAKARLGIGRLFGIRSRLAHDGVLDCVGDGLPDAFVRLADLVHAVLRSVSGLPYQGELEKYYSDPEPAQPSEVSGSA